MLDPTLIPELEAQPRSDQTIAFIRRILNGILFVSASAGAPAGLVIAVSGQVKTQDGEDKIGIQDITVRSIASLLGGQISVTSGTARAGNGTKACWLQTNSNGGFALNISGTGGERVILELVANHAEVVLLTLQF